MSSAWFRYLWPECPQQLVPSAHVLRGRFEASWSTACASNPGWQFRTAPFLNRGTFRFFWRRSIENCCSHQRCGDYWSGANTRLSKKSVFCICGSFSKFPRWFLLIGFSGLWPTARANALLCPVQTTSDAGHVGEVRFTIAIGGRAQKYFTSRGGIVGDLHCGKTHVSVMANSLVSSGLESFGRKMAKIFHEHFARKTFMPSSCYHHGINWL